MLRIPKVSILSEQMSFMELKSLFQNAIDEVLHIFNYLKLLNISF